MHYPRFKDVQTLKLSHDRRCWANWILRFLQLCFASVVIGFVSNFLYYWKDVEPYPAARLVYTEVVACFAFIAAVVQLSPINHSDSRWCARRVLFTCIDSTFALMWFAVFGALIQYVDGTHCASKLGPEWVAVICKDSCKLWKALEAFAFVSAAAWLASAIFLALGKDEPVTRKESQPDSETGNPRDLTGANNGVAV